MSGEKTGSKATQPIDTTMIPIPMCVVTQKGKIATVNEQIQQIFAYGDVENGDFFAMTGIKVAQLEESYRRETLGLEPEDSEDRSEESACQFPLTLERSGRIFKLVVGKETAEEEERLVVFFEDATAYENLKKQSDDEKMCVCRINIDNYSEMMKTVEEGTAMAVATEVDREIRKWAAKIEGSLDKSKEDAFSMYFQYHRIREIQSSKFAILDTIRAIETQADFPLSLSIGIGIGGKNPEETGTFADAALELALGRGGDQAVVKEGSRIRYYGGKTQSVEKSNKGKSRIISHALRKLIEQSDRVFIMGHRNTDMDAFGSSLGIYRMCINAGTEANIVLDNVSETLQLIYKHVKSAESYHLISSEKAETMMQRNDLLVVLDTHRPSYVEAPSLLERSDRIVVIDHHRMAEDGIQGATLSYIETYASSTAELVTELLQYTDSRRTIEKLEAEALLAGMTIDTNRFAVKTGVRTFEAAAWLRRAGADTTEVKRFFQTDIDAVKVRAKGLAAVELHENGIATSICEGRNQDAQVLNSQIADELLNIKGVRAAIVAGQDPDGVTCISARSLGEINVQIILEKMGGGGHLTTAGAQVDGDPEQVMGQILEIAEKMVKAQK